MTKLRILITGDVHGRWRHLNKLINKKRPDLVLVCGDFGYWPREHGKVDDEVCLYGSMGRAVTRRKRWYLDGIKNRGTEIRFCDGNHEDHESLLKLDNLEILPNIFYQPRGSTLTLPDGRVILFIGGAESGDKNFRIPGKDWFPEESISLRDIIELPDMRVDIVISHTCPFEFTGQLRFDYSKKIDPSCQALSRVLERYKPDLWYFGHWHQYKEGRALSTRWTALNMAPYGGWWARLK